MLKFTCLTASLAVFVSGDALAQCETAKILAPNPYQYSFFGAFVSASGDTALVGHHGFNGKAKAFVYERSDGPWMQTQILDGGPAQGSFSTPLALDGDTAMIGNIIVAWESGRVYVWERTGGSFAATQVLKPATSIGDSHFGRRLAIDGDRAVIAAPMDAHYKYRGGAVFVFERQAGTWVETARIDPPAPRTFGFFGISVALEGDVLVVGEPGYVGFSGDYNWVYVYRFSGAGWNLEQRLNPGHKIGFGYAVTAAPGRIVVGAFRDHFHGGPHAGSVYVYEDMGGAWQEVDKFWPTHPDAADHFGASVIMDGGRLVVGSAAPELIKLGNDVHVYEESGGSWILRSHLQHHDTATDSFFGAGLALSGDELWVGSPGDTQPNSPKWTGAAYTYTLADLVTSYCQPAAVNSTGLSGILRAAGCATLAVNSLVLTATRLPVNQFGVFLTSRVKDFVPFAGGSQGHLCLGGVIGRFLSQASSTGPAGELTVQIDANQLPLPGGSHTVAPGETWNFQAWFRDNNPGPTSNFTDGVSVTFL